MDKSTILLIAALLLVGFSFYRKFSKKNKGNIKSDPGMKPDSSFSSWSKDDDYEPYSKK